MIDKIKLVMVKPQEDPRGRLFFSSSEDGTVVKNGELRLQTVLRQKKRIIYPDVYKEADISQAQFHKIVKGLIDSGHVTKTIDENKKKWYQWEV